MAPLERAVRACRKHLTPSERNLVAPLFLCDAEAVTDVANRYAVDTALADACVLLALARELLEGLDVSAPQA